jgi:intracellular septation protein
VISGAQGLCARPGLTAGNRAATGSDYTAARMKILLDFLPILLFFATFKYADGHKEWAAAFATQHLGLVVAGGKVGVEEAPVLLATVVVVAATIVQVAWLKARRRKVDLMLWVSLVLVVVLGALTVWLHSDTFIKWKPTLLYWAMGLALWAGQAIFGRNLLRLLMGEQLTLPDPVWRRLNVAWIAFFSAMGMLNLWVAFTFATDVWVNFKLFGSLGLMIAFTVAQGFYLSRYLHDEPAEGATPAPDTSAGPEIR